MAIVRTAMTVVSNGSRVMDQKHAPGGSKMPVPGTGPNRQVQCLPVRGLVRSLFQILDDVLEAVGIGGIRGDQGLVGREDDGLLVT